MSQGRGAEEGAELLPQGHTEGQLEQHDQGSREPGGAAHEVARGQFVQGDGEGETRQQHDEPRYHGQGRRKPAGHPGQNLSQQACEQRG